MQVPKAHQDHVISVFISASFIIQTATSLIKKAEEEERAVYVTNTQLKYPHDRPKVGRVPPAPVLLCRTDRSMTFMPAPFTPDDGVKVRHHTRCAAACNNSMTSCRPCTMFHYALVVRDVVCTEPCVFVVGAGCMVQNLCTLSGRVKCQGQIERLLPARNR